MGGQEHNGNPLLTPPIVDIMPLSYLVFYIGVRIFLQGLLRIALQGEAGREVGPDPVGAL